jgi:mRNA-degrading endonuclease RelE of RelBE toxin-antitoxin system
MICVAEVRISDAALADLARVPLSMQERVLKVFEELAEWPEVSGVKWLRHEWKGHARKRTGDFRVIFRVDGTVVSVVRIAHRREVYE